VYKSCKSKGPKADTAEPVVPGEGSAAGTLVTSVKTKRLADMPTRLSDVPPPKTRIVRILLNSWVGGVKKTTAQSLDPAGGSDELLILPSFYPLVTVS
jgi:hypothetical protein